MSLVSREVIADSIELVGRGHMFDAIVALVACDKTIPGAAMALVRLNVPSVLLYGGSICTGPLQRSRPDRRDVFEAIGAHAAGKIDDAELKRSRTRVPGGRRLRRPVHRQHDGDGLEFIGLSPVGSAASRRDRSAQRQKGYEAGRS